MDTSAPPSLKTSTAWHARYVAESAARAGAAVIRRHADAVHTVEAKGTNDFVTEADTAAQEAIVEVLHRAFPDDTILAEEQARTEDITASCAGRRWIIDPIDGTTNFMHGIPPYAVSIALQHNDVLAAAVVLDVPHDKLYAAVRGQGATCNGAPIAVNESAPLQDVVLATGFPYRRFSHLETYVGVLKTILPKVRGVRRHGAAAIDLVRVAEGSFGAFYETGLSPWDVAAGALIVREAGGRVSTMQRDEALHPVFNAQVVATNGQVHNALLDLLTPLRETHA